MPPRTPEQLQEDFRRRTQTAPLPSVQAPPALQQPKRITNNYMGPPEAPTQVEPEVPAQAGPTGFVGFGQQLAANRDVAARMAGQAGQAAMAGGGADNLRTDAGRQALLQRAYGKAAQVTDFDAALAGGAGGDYFQQLQAAYGSEAQARQAQQRKDAAAAAAATQKRMDESGAAMQRQQREEAAAAEERRVQQEVLALRARGNNMQTAAGRVRNVTPEQWAAMHGMTLEQWVRSGKRPAY